MKGLMKTSILIFSILISSWITAKGEGEKLVLTDHPIVCDENSYRFASELPTKPLVLDESRANLSESLRQNKNPNSAKLVGFPLGKKRLDKLSNQ